MAKAGFVPGPVRVDHSSPPISSPPIESAPDNQWVELSRILTVWFLENQRELPWRLIRDPYGILVSEIMLQQTTVAAILAGNRWQLFLEKFPNWQSLASARTEAVLEAWAGLGYYRRARMLHELARTIVDQHQAAFPTTVKQWQALPGIGPYTAGAVASFALGLPVPIVDTNIARVLARFFGLRTPQQAGTPRLWELARRILPSDGELARLHNSALMELGALICKPKNPQCHSCPLASTCVAHNRDWIREIPPPRKPPTRLDRMMTALAIFRSDGCVLLRRVPAGEWHAGVWALPALLQPQELEKPLSPGQLPWYAKEMRLVDQPLESTFVVTRHWVRLRTWVATLPIQAQPELEKHPAENEFPWPDLGSAASTAYVWYPLSKAPELGLASPFRRVLSRLQFPLDPDLFLP